MNLSLTKKFTIGFLLVALTAALLMAISVRGLATEAMNRFLREQERNILIENLTAYYSDQGNWAGVADYYAELNNINTVQTTQNGNSRPQAPPNGNDNRPPPPAARNNRALFGMTDDLGVVLVPLPPRYQVGDRVSNRELTRDGTPMELEGDVIGYILTANLDNAEITPEVQNFIRFINIALLTVTAVSVLLALALGIFLTRSLTRPVKDLTTATQAITAGALGQQVPIRSKDELGTLAQTFNQMSTDLAFATEARKQMTADIAHDLRSPLTVLSGYLESMEDGVLQATPARLNAMHQEVEQLQHLVTDLRTLSLADAGELNLNLRPLNINQLLQKTATSYQHQAEQQQILIQVDAPANLPDINGDEARMTQMLGNLVINALRHTFANGRIWLKAAAQNNNVQIMVQDTGEGIAADDLPHIFDRFYRADKARHAEQSGMGLAIAKSIVEAHGGKIWATSQIGQGTTFFIQLAII